MRRGRSSPVPVTQSQLECAHHATARLETVVQNFSAAERRFFWPSITSECIRHLCQPEEQVQKSWWCTGTRPAGVCVCCCLHIKLERFPPRLPKPHAQASIVDMCERERVRGGPQPSPALPCQTASEMEPGRGARMMYEALGSTRRRPSCARQQPCGEGAGSGTSALC